jgi:hypothetical protein
LALRAQIDQMLAQLQQQGLMDYSPQKLDG